MPNKKTAKHTKRNEHGTNNQHANLIATSLLVTAGVLLVGGGIVLSVIAYVHVNEQSVKTKFLTDALINLLILVAIIFQAFVYVRQWSAMKESLFQGRCALEISERARLGIHSIKESFNTGRVVMRIENTGKAPATDIQIFTEGLAHIPEHCVPDEATKTPPWKRVGNGWRLIWPINVDYGNTNLLAGNNPLIMPFSIDDWVNRKQRGVIEGGDGHLIFRGRISFHDGFRAYQETEFAFKYSKGEGDWIHHPIDSPEQVWEKLREQSEQHVGGQGPLYRMVESYPPSVKITPAKEAKPEDKTEANSEKQ